MTSTRNLDYSDPFVVRLRNLRKKYNYSFKDLERLTGISSSTLQRYEQGLGANMPMNKLWAIADAYNVSTSYFLGYESSDLPYEQYATIIPLLREEGYDINYHSENESFSLDFQNTSVPISIEQIKALKETIKSYLLFKLSELKEPPTTE